MLMLIRYTLHTSARGTAVNSDQAADADAEMYKIYMYKC